MSLTCNCVDLLRCEDNTITDGQEGNYQVNYWYFVPTIITATNG